MSFLTQCLELQSVAVGMCMPVTHSSACRCTPPSPSGLPGPLLQVQSVRARLTQPAAALPDGSLLFTTASLHVRMAQLAAL